MREKPILFTAPMVRALLEGRKTQTRRVVKFPKTFSRQVHGAKLGPYPIPLGLWEPTTFGGHGTFRIVRGGRIDVPEEVAMWNPKGATCICCPYGQSGDRLWVRETWAFKAWTNLECEKVGCPDAATSRELYMGIPMKAIYKATYRWHQDCGPWKPSIFMPRWASRITLEIIRVRVERLQEITEGDAIAEGAEKSRCGQSGYAMEPEYSHRTGFVRLWDQTNGKKYAWESNPWVWVIEFKKVDGLRPFNGRSCGGSATAHDEKAITGGRSKSHREPKGGARDRAGRLTAQAATHSSGESDSR